MNASRSLSAGPSRSHKVLFWASFFTLIAAGIGFSVRGAILKDWGNQFGFTQGELGTITGGGLIGFGLAIIFFSFFADRFGYGKLMLVAFLLHASSAVVTFAATPVYQAYGKEGAYWCLYIGMWLFALGNGTCEAVINPLTATLFPDNKTHWLNILHAGWPLGLVLGAGIVLAFGQSAEPIRWEIKLGVFLVPVLIYGLLMFGKSFPESEAATAGVSMSESMKTIGLVGFALVAALLGLLLQNEIPPLLKPKEGPAPEWHKFIGWAIAGGVWAIFWVTSKFAFGSIIIAFIYLMHALVGYVELGTDSWITNITTTVLANEKSALLAFIWTNVLMCFLRFFAGPIVHKINPIGLLFVSAVLGTLGLWLLGQSFTNSVWPWVAAVTVYALGKTFYWPTLLGVISERYPKGGALALGMSGGIGMMCAGLIGAPGIGYKQDYFAVEKLKADGATATYERYVARDDKGEHSTKPFPVLTLAAPDQFKPIAGLDNGKKKVFDDYKTNILKVYAAIEAKKPADEVPVLLGTKDEKKDIEVTPKIGADKVTVSVTFVSQETADKMKEAAKTAGKPEPKVLMTTLQSDLATIAKLKKEDKKVEAKLEETLTKQRIWWETEGQPNFSTDEAKLDESQLVGSKKALLYTAIVPAILAVGFLLLIVYFAATGGYKVVHLEAPRPYDPNRGVGAPADQWGR